MLDTPKLVRKLCMHFLSFNMKNAGSLGQVGNILVVGHSRCGGIHALMSAEDDADAGYS